MKCYIYWTRASLLGIRAYTYTRISPTQHISLLSQLEASKEALNEIGKTQKKHMLRGTQSEVQDESIESHSHKGNVLGTTTSDILVGQHNRTSQRGMPILDILVCSYPKAVHFPEHNAEPDHHQPPGDTSKMRYAKRHSQPQARVGASHPPTRPFIHGKNSLHHAVDTSPQSSLGTLKCSRPDQTKLRS